MPLVIDASVALKWFISDERTSPADALLTRVMLDSAYVSALFRWEAQSALRIAEVAGCIEANEVDDALDTLRDLPIYVEPPGGRYFAGAETRLARHHDLTVYDTAYLAVALTHRLQLATADDALAYAARDLGILGQLV